MVAWRAIAGPPRPPAPADARRERRYISSFAVMSGSEHKPTQPFQGANLGALMGGVKLDLTGAEMQGDTATIEVFAVSGRHRDFRRPRLGRDQQGRHVHGRER